MIKSKQLQRKQLVLVVDDQEINRDVLGVILEDCYEVIYACDGEEAIEKIREHTDDLSLVMLDLVMPRMNGFEVLDAMRADEQMSGIPVIVLTAEKDAELKALNMGALDFITKPFDMHEVILARVGRIIELSEGRNLISAAEHDKISGLYTKNFFFEYANRIYTYHKEMHFDAVVMNIEQFHSLNALNGREFGDEVLRVLGGEIREFLNETEGIASRADADRFSIYCKPQADYGALLKRFQIKLDSISPNVNILLRMGVDPWREEVEPVLLFDRARTACNMVRGDYQHPLMIYNEDMRKKETLDRQLLNDLSGAIKSHQFKVYFQPKYDIKCDPPRLSSAEALVRWIHPELGFISPGEFIPLLEGNGLISMVDNYVWQKTAEQIVLWKKKYGFTLPVSVNLSRADIFDLGLIKRLEALIKENGLDFEDLKLEVTESAYTENAKKLLDVISGLREIGFQIEMDDFGSGYSSLNMLSEMPVDVLKIDMKFVRNIETSETDRRLVQLILDIARYLKAKTIAEGAETETQVNLLREFGVDLVQGYYFSRPLPADEFEQLIEREIDTKRG